MRKIWVYAVTSFTSDYKKYEYAVRFGPLEESDDYPLAIHRYELADLAKEFKGLWETKRIEEGWGISFQPPWDFELLPRGAISRYRCRTLTESEITTFINLLSL